MVTAASRSSCRPAQQRRWLRAAPRHRRPRRLVALGQRRPPAALLRCRCAGCRCSGSPGTARWPRALVVRRRGRLLGGPRLHHHRA
eukprot:11492310-Alexandrium_andersonii.AAC.1